MKLQKGKEYEVKWNPALPNRSQKKDATRRFVYLGEIAPNRDRKQPMYLFRDKKGGFCETFSAAQVADWSFVAVGSKRHGL